jgi:hypothetical protein
MQSWGQAGHRQAGGQRLISGAACTRMDRGCRGQAKIAPKRCVIFRAHGLPVGSFSTALHKSGCVYWLAMPIRMLTDYTLTRERLGSIQAVPGLG